jgi:hypothetical protein
MLAASRWRRPVTTILGVDPGIRGGLAIVTVDDGAAPRLVDAIDIPVTGTGAKERVDAIALRAWIVTHKPQHAYIERAQAMPKQGGSSGFKYGPGRRRNRGGASLLRNPDDCDRTERLEETPSTARQGQGRRSAARFATVSGGPRPARA